MERGKIIHFYLLCFPLRNLEILAGKTEGSLSYGADRYSTDILASILSLLLLYTGCASYLDSVFTFVSCKDERNARGQCAWS